MRSPRQSEVSPLSWRYKKAPKPEVMTLGGYGTPPVMPFEWVNGGYYRATSSYGCHRSQGSWCRSLYYTVSGGGYFTQNNETFHARAHDVFLLDANVPHHYGTAPGFGEWEKLWICFNMRLEWFQILDWPVCHPGLHKVSLRGKCKREYALQCLYDAVRLSVSPLSLDGLRAMHCLEEFLLLCHESIPGGKHATLDARIERTLWWIRQNLRSSIGVSDLAKVAGLSDSRFAHLFRVQMGKSPADFLESSRLELAKNYLRMTPHSVTEIAEFCGYSSLAHFSNRFKATVGPSPLEYRRSSPTAK